MLNISRYIRTPKIQKWLFEFFNTVDSGRLRRGSSLYRSGALLAFSETDDGFIATMLGSHGDEYEIDGEIDYIHEDGYLDVDELYVECSCPDDTYVCKHSVCAVIHWAVEMDKRLSAGRSDERGETGGTLSTGERFAWKLPTAKEDQPQQQPFAELEQQWHSLERHVRKGDHTLLELNNPSFWPFKDGLDQVMDDVQRVVKDTLKLRR